MNTIKSLALLVLAAGGCASVAPPHELVAARSAYNAAAGGPAGQLDPADLHTAKETLQAAEQSFDRDGDTQDTKDIAYAAERRAEVATARADALASLRQRDAVVAAMNANQTAQVQLTSAELGRANQQLTAEKQHAADAEQRAAAAAADLARIASIKQEPRGMVITLSGSVLFASGKADLLPAAQAKLEDVANALLKQNPDSKIVVQGYTDSRGSDSLNQALSQRRAEAVRSTLVRHGVPEARVSAEGEGPANPIADNASAEGRADNRRVEIVVQPAAR